MKFSKSDLQEMAWMLEGEVCEGFETYEVISNEQTDSSRWSSHHELIFKCGDKFYRTTYSKGLTECQDERPFEYDAAEIECVEVFPKQVTTTVYVEAA